MKRKIMTDKELLVLAAKAIGFGAPESGSNCWTESEYPRNSGTHGALWNYIGYMDTAELWNPLTCDGDAFRLAVKLNLSTYIIADKAWAYVAESAAHQMKTDIEDDPYAAQRRAIVLCAVQIAIHKELA